MKYEVDLESTAEGDYVASCSDLGLTARGLSATNALDALRADIQFHVELCPCSSIDPDEIELQVRE